MKLAVPLKPATGIYIHNGEWVKALEVPGVRVDISAYNTYHVLRTVALPRWMRWAHG